MATRTFTQEVRAGQLRIVLTRELLAGFGYLLNRELAEAIADMAIRVFERSE